MSASTQIQQLNQILEVSVTSRNYGGNYGGNYGRNYGQSYTAM